MPARHALIIDDNLSNVEVLMELLTLEGVEYTAIQPVKSSDDLQNFPDGDIIFLDLEMPHIDGYQLFNYLKQDHRFQNTPIVAYTVHVSEVLVARDMGFHSFLGKPLDADQFPEQLKHILNGQHVWVY